MPPGTGKETPAPVSYNQVADAIPQNGLLWPAKDGMGCFIEWTEYVAA